MNTIDYIGFDIHKKTSATILAVLTEMSRQSLVSCKMSRDRFLTQDEPEEGGEYRMLRIDHPHASSRKTEPGGIRAFLEASEEVQLEGQNREEVYRWVNTTLRQHDDERLGRVAKALLHHTVVLAPDILRSQLNIEHSGMNLGMSHQML